jgi:hypothetical protein
MFHVKHWRHEEQSPPAWQPESLRCESSRSGPRTLNKVSRETSIRGTREAEGIGGTRMADAKRRSIGTPEAWSLREVSRETLPRGSVPVRKDRTLGMRFGMFHVKQSAGMSQRNIPRNSLFWTQDPGSEASCKDSWTL